MKLLPTIAAAAALVTSATVVDAQDAQPPAESQPVQVQPAAQAPAPRPEGQWVYTEEYGWVWVPAGASTSPIGDEPYVYLYTPAYGWTWYVSPWGWGPFNYGPWLHRPWAWHYAPRVWGGRVWIAPRVHVWPHAYGSEHFGYRGVYHGGFHGAFQGGGSHGGFHGHR